MTKKKHKPDPEILARMTEEERKKLLHRKAKLVAGERKIDKNQAGEEAKKKRDPYSEEAIREAGREAAKSTGKKSKPSILKLMSNNGGRLQNQRAKHQTGSPRFF